MHNLEQYTISQKHNPHRFYVYEWRDENDTVYYVGRGTGPRCLFEFRKPCKAPTCRSRIKLVDVNLTREDADKLEIQLIQKYKRKVDGGTLENISESNHGRQKGYKHSPQARAAISAGKRASRDYIVYLFYRNHDDMKKGIPYYCGSGKRNRCLARHGPEDKSLIEIVHEGLSKQQSLDIEEKLTRYIGIESEGGPLENIKFGNKHSNESIRQKAKHNDIKWLRLERLSKLGIKSPYKDISLRIDEKPSK